jgi:hypothetical protein
VPARPAARLRAHGSRAPVNQATCGLVLPMMTLVLLAILALPFALIAALVLWLTVTIGRGTGSR